MRTPKHLSVAVVGIIAAVILTPLCGLWFSCGCDWPWERFFMACNALVKNAPTPHCPWCVYPMAAVMSIGIGSLSTLLATWRCRELPGSAGISMLYRCGIGTAVFVGVLMLAGWFTALATHHPSFLGLGLS